MYQYTRLSESRNYDLGGAGSGHRGGQHAPGPSRTLCRWDPHAAVHLVRTRWLQEGLEQPGLLQRSVVPGGGTADSRIPGPAGSCLDPFARTLLAVGSLRGVLHSGSAENTATASDTTGSTGTHSCAEHYTNAGSGRSSLPGSYAGGYRFSVACGHSATVTRGGRCRRIDVSSSGATSGRTYQRRATSAATNHQNPSGSSRGIADCRISITRGRSSIGIAAGWQCQSQHPANGRTSHQQSGSQPTRYAVANTDRNGRRTILPGA